MYRNIKSIRQLLAESGVTIFFRPSTAESGKYFKLGESMGQLAPGTTINAVVQVYQTPDRMPLLIQASLTQHGETDKVQILKPATDTGLPASTDHAYFGWQTTIVAPDGNSSSKKGTVKYPDNRFYILLEDPDGNFTLIKVGIVTQNWENRGWADQPISSRLIRDDADGSLAFGDFGCGLLWRGALEELDQTGRFNHIPIRQAPTKIEKTPPAELADAKVGTTVVKFFNTFQGGGYGWRKMENGGVIEGRIRSNDLPLNEDGVRSIFDGAWLMSLAVGTNVPQQGKNAGVVQHSFQQLTLIEAPKATVTG